jgi:nucleotide-binding universal stress UspA family protein
MNEEISKIMVCIDGSEASIKTARKALEIAKKKNAKQKLSQYIFHLFRII